MTLDADCTATLEDGSKLDLLGPGKIEELRLDLTTRCNLRCVYCPVTHPDHVAFDMSVEQQEAALAWVREMAADGRFSVSVNGVGETTHMSGWESMCRQLFSMGLPVSMTSNLAKEMDEAELETLAQFATIAVSLDSADRDLLRRIRRKEDLRLVVWNIQAIRATAVRLGRAPPRIEVICGLYDANSLQIERLAEMIVALAIPKVTFWNLWLHAGTPAATDGPMRLRPLAELLPSDLRPRLAAIEAAFGLLERHNVEISMPGGFLETIQAQVNDHA